MPIHLDVSFTNPRIPKVPKIPKSPEITYRLAKKFPNPPLTNHIYSDFSSISSSSIKSSSLGMSSSSRV